MATVTPNFNWPVPTSTDLVKDGATAIEALGDSIDASMVDLKGGTTGQVLAKASGTDMDFSWVAQDDSNAIQNSIVDAKGDLIAASANDTPARLAVGNNGETLVADSSTATGLRWQVPVNVNPILNSAFQIWQRGTTFASAANQSYSADRWFYGIAGTSNYTISRQVTGDTTNLPSIQYCARLARASGNTNTAQQYFANVFETVNSIPYAGKTVTFSYYARVGANWSGTGFVGRASSGTSTDASFFSGPAGNDIATSTPTLTTTWQRFTATGTVGTTATQLSVYFTWSPSGTAGANDYVEVTGVQLEVGSVATPFKTYAGTIQGELAACQRYYYRLNGGGNWTNFGSGMAFSATVAITNVSFPVTMRVKPTALEQSGTAANYATFRASSNTDALTSVPTFFNSTTTSAVVRSESANLAAGNATSLLDNNNTTAYLAWSAEL